jgi:hypothetical protein
VGVQRVLRQEVPVSDEVGGGSPTERDRLLAEYERRTGTRPRWLDEVTVEGLQWHLERVGGEEAAASDE